MSNKKRLLVVDDEEAMRHVLQSMLSKEGYAVSTASNGAEALKALDLEIYDIVLSDVRMPVMDGLIFFREMKKKGHLMPVIMMSAYGSIDLAVEAIKEGAYDFISKPFRQDEIKLTLKKAEERERLTKENTRLKKEVEKNYSFSKIIGNSSKMREVFNAMEKVAKVKSTVLLTGESGTGKELVSKDIHYNSDRKDSPFIAVNCGAIPENLVESELFGHVKGAFTDAVKTRKGLFEEADGGTFLLDEIGELPLNMQVKLLRVLQEGEVTRIGSATPIKVDVRIIAATTKDLALEVKEGRFRDDLYYRLNVFSIKLPSLRERMEDVPLLVEHFIVKICKKLGSGSKSMNKEALAMILNYSWPGNIRELENAIERAIVMSDGDDMSVNDLPAIFEQKGPTSIPFISEENLSIKKGNKVMERTLISKALEKTKGNRTKAARLLEISHRALIYKIKDYCL